MYYLSRFSFIFYLPRGSFCCHWIKKTFFGNGNNLAIRTIVVAGYCDVIWKLERVYWDRYLVF